MSFRSVSWVIVVAMLSAPGAALAHNGFRASVALGYGKLSGSNLVTSQVSGAGDIPLDAGEQDCCPSGGFALDLRAGWTFAGIVGPELGIVGYTFPPMFGAGSGFAGGGLRFYPLGLVGLATDMSEFPIDLSFGALFGYTLVGKDFALNGSFFGFDGTLEYKLSSLLSLGARLNLFIPNYSNFAFTDYSGDLGRCLGSNGEHIGMAGDDSIHKKGAEPCTGNGPSASYLSPELVLTFHVDVL